MNSSVQRILQVFLYAYLLAIHVLLLYFVGERIVISKWPSDISAGVVDPTERGSIPTPLPVPESFGNVAEIESNSNAIANASPVATPQAVATKGLIIPVAGVRADQLIDTFSAARSENRSHDAIDIVAAQGTPVVAAVDGEIVRFFDSDRGGVTIYQLTPDKQFVLYYAHLQQRAPEISVGMSVRQGTTIGFVGDTGNAGPGNFHLHFSIARISDPKRFWAGVYINPYPILRSGTYPQ